MKAVILDRSSFDRGDLDFSAMDFSGVEWISWEGTRPDQTRDRIEDCAIIVTNKVRLDSVLLRDCPALKIIIIAATGIDNVDTGWCRENGIVVCNVRQYATPAVAQHTITLMLNLMTRQVQYAHDVRHGAWSKSEVFCLLDYPIIETSGRVLGIVGFGTLGKQVAHLAEAFGMTVKVCQRPGGEPVPGRVPLKELLETADVVTLHCPLTEDTHHLLGAEEFAMMKNSAIVLNTARGAIIDSVALVDALQNGDIAGAGIDVLDQEPPPVDHTLLQSDIPNLILTPHNAWASQESRQRLVDQMAKILGSWFDGEPMNAVT